MASPPPTLNTLPAELIKRIASFSRAEDIFSLIRVNRHLHAVAYDGAVFKSILQNRNNQPLDSSAWPLHFLPSTSDIETLARFALADSRARSWTTFSKTTSPLESPESGSRSKDGQKEDRKQGRLARGFDWMAALAAAQHPFVREIDIPDALNHYDKLYPRPKSADPRRDSDEGRSFDFVITCAVLHQASVLGTSPANPDVVTEKINEVKRILIRQDLQGNACPTAAVLALALWHSVKRNPLRINILPPTLAKIPLLENLKRLIPFTMPPENHVTKGGDNSERQSFLTWHLPIMTSKRFLEDGEWVGYYSYGIQLQNGSFDPPMKAIKFVVEETLPGVMKLTARGVDMVGRFGVEGDVLPDGQVKLRKTYDAGFFWDWNAKMTPFGIIGIWGRAQSESGCLWLWKKSWSE